MTDQSTPLTASAPRLLILNQMAGPMTWELAEDLGKELGCVALLTGHPDTLAKGSTAQVRMTPAPAYQRGSFARRAFSWLQYTFHAFFWLWRFPRTTPVLLFSNPPILCWLGWLMRLLRGQKYAVMVHDIYPDVLVRLQGMPEQHLLIRVWRWLNRHAYNRAQVVMTLGEYMAENLARQFDPARTPAGKVEVVYPWVDTERIKPIPKEENWFAQKYGQVGKLTVMYSGNMGLGHDIETMVEAARLLKDEPDINFMFIGSGPKWQMVHEHKEKYQLTNVILLPWQSEEVLPYSLACADVAIVSIENEIAGLAVPSKAIYAIGTGAILLVVGGIGSELNFWINQYSIDFFEDVSSSINLTNAIERIFRSPMERQKINSKIRKVTQKKFSRYCNGHLLYDLLLCNLFALNFRRL